MGQSAVTVVAAALAVAGGMNPDGPYAAHAVRAEGARIERLIAGGLERSATFRALVTQLDHGNVVVYVRFSRCAGDLPACLLWASSAAGFRRLVVRLDPFGRSENDLTALLAHELQHAIEVASDPRATDAASFRRLFAELGWKNANGFDTADAHDVMRQVRRELIQQR